MPGKEAQIWVEPRQTCLLAVDLGQLACDCPSSHPLVEAGGASLLKLVSVLRLLCAELCSSALPFRPPRQPLPSPSHRSGNGGSGKHRGLARVASWEDAEPI